MRGWQILVGMFIVFVLTSIVFIVTPRDKVKDRKYYYDYLPERIDVNSSSEGYIENEVNLRDFFTKASSHKKAYVRVIGHSVDGDPFYTDVYYNKGKITMIQQSTRDPFYERPLFQQTCKRIEVRVDNRHFKEYILTGCSKTNDYTLAWEK